jgi:radical SAM superfamily enzyme YgiQ (UPF0313 family)
MRIQFIWPNFDAPIGISIGISYLSGALQQAGHDTRIIHICEWLDYSFNIPRIISDIKVFNPDLIAISTGQNHYHEMQLLGKAISDELGKPIILGGIHATLNTMDIMNQNQWLQFANVGEGEDSILDLINALEQGKETTNIPNIWARKNGNVVSNPIRPLRNLNTIPWMDLENWQFRKITEARRGWVNISLNRGCPYRCSYCHNNGVAKIYQRDLKTVTSNNEDIGYLRLRGIDDIIGELKSIIEKYDFVKAFSFIDDTFTMDKNYIKLFLQRYKKEINLPFVCNTTVLDVDQEVLELMKDANCDLVRFGVETATDRIKKNVMLRNFSNKKTEEVFAICRQIGLRSFAFTLLANPTETRSEMLNTLMLNARLLPDGMRISLGYPYPGTDYFDIADDLGVIDYSKRVHNYLDESILKWSDADRLWIDKVRSLYWWWVNSYLENDAALIYTELIRIVENLSEAEWKMPDTKSKLWDLDASLSNVIKLREINHYTIPFKDRLDICILHVSKPSLEKELLDEH